MIRAALTLMLPAAALLIAAAPKTKPAAAKSSPAVPRAPASPPVAGDWNSYVQVSQRGTYIVGNPAAKVQVIEYLSYTCSHCAAFSVESGPVFRDQMIKSGSLVVEYRPVAREQLDLAATMLVRCIGPKRFAAAHEALFAKQDDWLPIGYGFLNKDAHKFALEPPLEQLKITAQLSGLSDLMMTQGMTRAEVDACFTNEPVMRQMAANGDATRTKIKGTPTFVINGVQVGSFTWAGLEPQLRAKGAK